MVVPPTAAAQARNAAPAVSNSADGREVKMNEAISAAAQEVVAARLARRRLSRLEGLASLEDGYRV